MKVSAWRRRLRSALAEASERLGYEAAWLLVPSAVDGHWLIAERIGRPDAWHVVVTSELIGCFPEGLCWAHGDPLSEVGERLGELGCRALAIVPVPGSARLVLGSSAHRTRRAADEAVGIALDDLSELVAPLVAESPPPEASEPADEPSTGAEEIAYLLTLPRWTDAQRATLVAFARRVGSAAPTDEDVSTLLAGAARLGGDTSRAQRPVLSLVARSIGVDRLIAFTKLDGDVRLGATWLLIEEGSLPALRTVASLGNDKRQEVRVAAALALSLLRRPSPEG